MPSGIYSNFECLEKHGKFTPQEHQAFVKDYFLKSPFKGLLLYHRLGSGKTCSSIIIGDALLKMKDAIFGSDLGIVKALVEHGADISAESGVLGETLRDKKLDIARYLISQGAGITDKELNSPKVKQTLSLIKEQEQ